MTILFAVPTPDQKSLEETQKIAFKYGYKWSSGNYEILIRLNGCNYIYFGEKYLTHSSNSGGNRLVNLSELENELNQLTVSELVNKLKTNYPNHSVVIETDGSGTIAYDCDVDIDNSDEDNILFEDANELRSILDSIKIDDNVVEVKDNGNVRVGCTEVEFEKLERIYKLASAKNGRKDWNELTVNFE